MRNSRLLPFGVLVVLCTLTVFAQRSTVTDKDKDKDSAPWQIIKVAKLSRTVDAKAATASKTGPQKYLHVEIRYNLPAKRRTKHRFRVTDRRGKPVGELWGSSKGRSLLVFEGSWADLRGLYLDGDNHREPLVREPAAVAQGTGKKPQDRPQSGARRPTVGLPGGPNSTKVLLRRPVVPTAPIIASGRTNRTNVGVGRTRVTSEAATVASRAAVGASGNSVGVPGGAVGGRDGAAGVAGRSVAVAGGTSLAAGGMGLAAGGMGLAAGGRGAAEGGSPNTSNSAPRGADAGRTDSAGNALSPQPGRGQGPDNGSGADAAARGGEGNTKGPSSGNGQGKAEGSATGTGQGRDPGTEAAQGSRSQPDSSQGSASGANNGDGRGNGDGPGKGTGAPEVTEGGPGAREGVAKGEGTDPAAGEGPTPETEASEETGTKPAPAEANRSEQNNRPEQSSRPKQNEGEARGRGESDPAQPTNATEESGEDGQREQPDATPNQTPANPAAAGGRGNDGHATGGGTGSGGGTGLGGGMGLGGRGGQGGGSGLGGGRGPSRGFGHVTPFRSGGGSGYGNGRGTGYGEDPGNGRGNDPGDYEAIKEGAPVKLPVMPEFVLYIATGDEAGPGTVYQVNEHGRVLGKVKLPYTATGMALHRTHGLVLAIPRDNGKIMRIDETGKLSTLLENDRNLVHPVDVGVGGNSDTVLVADNTADVLAATTTGGTRSKVYERLEGQQWDEQDMSVAVTNDKHVIFGTDGDEGIYRFAGDDYSASADPILPGAGGVAADPKSLRWAATQRPNRIHVFEGQELVKKLRLPAGKSLYRQGLLSFSPCGSICVAVRDRDEVGEPWFLMYDIEKDGIRSLFPWKGETMTDFVVGPRMLWNRNSRNPYKSIY